MSSYHVVFAMPEWIAKGIASGIYEVIGGVVRNTATKQVVMWLRPGLDESGKLAVANLPHLPTLASGAAFAATTGLTAATAIIAVAGFVWIGHKIDQVETQLSTIESKLDAIGKDVSWLKNKVRKGTVLKFKAALHNMSSAENIGDFNSLSVPRMVFHETQGVYRDQLEEILALPCPLAEAPAFVEFAQSYVVATQVRARATALYQDVATAIREAEEEASIYGALCNRFLAPLSEPDVNLSQLVQLTEEQNIKLQQVLPGLPMIAETEYIHLPGLSRNLEQLTELRRISTPRMGHSLVGIVPFEAAPIGWQPP